MKRILRNDMSEEYPSTARIQKMAELFCPSSGITFTPRIKKDWYIIYLLFINAVRRLPLAAIAVLMLESNIFRAV
ncbi:hypothetical protein DDR33_21150 [Pararcticibacter amylolyticus]|uniref:Uncharacterized protein n=1 Tax=Pararcticibacter amylolyticus TaxID=2173175 RepID=A0A2U2PBJ2_9SPHI|nr:hypothetical protein DDR33_21150 [Pararcticibacter amylolyticus]